PDGPDKGTMVVTVEPPDQDPQIITVIVEYEDSTWKITEIVPEEPPVSPSDPPETGLSLNPIVFESIGQPPDVVEQKAGKMRNAYYSEGVFFEFGEYTFEFSDFTGDLDGEDMGPNGICTGFLGELHQIIDGATDLISIADLEALFGQAVEKIEPAQTIRGGAELGGIRYKQHGISVAIYYSAASGDDFFSSRDQVAVYLDSR
ncbi:MAG: hypothetical protein FWD29_07925, partial [Micrococcales bacterium]|nr:hypothetical protein [Micrococcales bacterium]